MYEPMEVFKFSDSGLHLQKGGAQINTPNTRTVHKKKAEDGSSAFFCIGLFQVSLECFLFGAILHC